MTVKDLHADVAFRFVGETFVWIANGNGWFGFPYSGGPWLDTSNRQVVLCDDQGHDIPDPRFHDWNPVVREPGA